MSEKIILVHKNQGKRMGLSLALSMHGHNVQEFKDGHSALSHIVQNGEAPFVLVGEMDMGDVYTPGEMKKCLKMHSKRTGIPYGIISIDVPEDMTAKTALALDGIGHTHGSEVCRIRDMVKYEFQSL